MLKSHAVVSWPIYVWQYAPELMTYNELICLGHFLAIAVPGKKAWSIVAQRMGTTDKAIKAVLSRLTTKGLITVERGVIDAGPLYNKCLGLSGGYDATAKITPEPKSPDTGVAYKTAATITSMGLSHLTVHQLRNGIVGTLLKSVDVDSVIDAFVIYNDISAILTTFTPRDEWLLLFTKLNYTSDDVIPFAQAGVKVIKGDTLTKTHVIDSNIELWIDKGRQAY